MAYISFQPQDYFNTVLYNGTGSAQSITGVGFQPDWLWQKSRSNSQDSRIFDAVRGGSKVIYSSLTNGETTDAQLITSFDSDGFTMGSSGTNVNDSGTTNVAWNWKANGAGSSNTDGSITSTVSANTTSGMSIVKWTGTGASATVGHGLGVTPDMIICKNLDATAEDWVVWNNSFSASQFIRLNTTDAVATSTGMWDNTLPTSSVFSLKNEEKNNNSSQDIIAYCFADVKGFSKFGVYAGNADADGSFVYTGFKPAFIMIKKVGGASASWVMFDSKRLGYNVANYQLYANSSTSYGNNVLLDITSQGFKCRANHADVNGSGATYIYMAFAEEPLVSSNGVPATAR